MTCWCSAATPPVLFRTGVSSFVPARCHVIQTERTVIEFFCLAACRRPTVGRRTDGRRGGRAFFLVQLTSPVLARLLSTSVIYRARSNQPLEHRVIRWVEEASTCSLSKRLPVPCLWSLNGSLIFGQIHDRSFFLPTLLSGT